MLMVARDTERKSSPMKKKKKRVKLIVFVTTILQSMNNTRCTIAIMFGWNGKNDVTVRCTGPPYKYCTVGPLCAAHLRTTDIHAEIPHNKKSSSHWFEAYSIVFRISTFFFSLFNFNEIEWNSDTVIYYVYKCVALIFVYLASQCARK